MMKSKLLVTYNEIVPYIATQGIYVDWKEEIKNRFLAELNKELQKRTLTELCDIEQTEYGVIVRMRALFQTGEYNEHK